MIKYTLVDASEKDIEILTSMKSITMIDDRMDKKLNYNEKKKIKNDIAKNIQESYSSYKLIYVGKKLAGAFALIDYKDGLMLDQIYLFKEYRNMGIGTNIINDIISANRKVYLWTYKSNKDALRLFRGLGFTCMEENGSVLILKYDTVYIKMSREMANIKLGYIDRQGNRYVKPQGDFKDNYYLQTPNSVLETGIGLCFDQVELERSFITKLKLDFRTYFMFYQDSNKELGPSHAFLIFKDNNKYYWFENAWYKYKGIHEYETLDDALNDIKYKFVATLDSFSENKFRLYSFDKPRAGINYTKYIGNAINGRIIKI